MTGDVSFRRVELSDMTYAAQDKSKKTSIISKGRTVASLLDDGTLEIGDGLTAEEALAEVLSVCRNIFTYQAQELRKQ